MKARTEECSNCGAPARRVRGDYEWENLGLPNVVLRGIELVKCGKCGNVDPVFPRVAQIMRRIALTVVRKPYRLTGDEVRFLRKHLQMTGEEFGAVCQVDRTTVSKWENGETPVGPQSDALIRMVALALGDFAAGQNVPATVRGFARINGAPPKPARIELDVESLEAVYI